MKLSDLLDMWHEDVQMDKTELAAESLRVPQLHHKYYKAYVQEGLLFKKLESDYKLLLRQKTQYYAGTMSEEELDELGWEPQPMKILKQDITLFIEGDEHIRLLQAKLDMQKQKIDFLESVIRSISNRGYLIKNAIDWERFKMGA
jgi:Recombination, repair and ssDNA binding protein UvsY